MAVKMVIHEGGAKDYLRNNDELGERHHIWRHLYVNRDVLGEYHRDGEAQNGKSLTEIMTGCGAMHRAKPEPKMPGIQTTGLLSPVDESEAESDLLNALLIMS